MTEKLDTSDRRRSPLGFLGALALIVAVEYFLARHKEATYGGSHWAYETARSATGSAARGSQVLCFGDSLLKQGLVPTVIEERSGLKAYNFAIAGGQAPGDYFLLRRALESGARPSAIVVEYFPRLMSRDPDFNLENWPFLANPIDCFEMGRLARSATLATDLMLRQVFPSLRCRNSIRENLKYALNGSFTSFAGEVFSARRNWKINRGAEIVPCRPERFDDLDSWMRGYFPQFECTSTNRVYIHKFLDLAAQHHIPVFWVLPPYTPDLQARCEQSGFDAVHESFLRELQARFPGLYVADGRRAGYDRRVFTDPHHLGRQGSVIFTASLADLLRQHREAPSTTERWTALRGYQTVASLAPLEDMDESRRQIHQVTKSPADSRLR